MVQCSSFYFPKPTIGVVKGFNRSGDRNGTCASGVNNPASGTKISAGLATFPRIVFCWLSRVLISGSLAFTVAGTHATARTYTTDFSLTEDPISESGNWINGRVVGL